MKRLGRVFTAVALAFLLFFPVLCLAPPAPDIPHPGAKTAPVLMSAASAAPGDAGAGGSLSSGSGSSNDSQSDQESEGGGDGGGPLAAISELISTIKQFVDTVGKILRGEIFDIFVEWWGKQLQKTLDPLIGAFGAVFLYTPYLHSHPWVHSWWSWTFWMSFGLLFAATVWAGIKVFTASADPGKDMWKPLKVVGVALVSALVSLWAVDFLILLVNKMGAAVLTDAVRQVASLGGKQIALNGQDDGALVMGLLFSSDAALKNPPALYQMLLSQGLFLLTIIMIEILVLALFAMARFFVLCVLAVAAPLYFVGASLTSRMETLVGWWALVARTVFFQLVYAVAWNFCVSVRLAEEGKATSSGPLASPSAAFFGAKATFIEMVILLALIYVTWKFWARPTWAALKEPATLGGARVILSAAALASGASRTLGLVSKTLGSPDIGAAGIKLGEYAGRLRRRGEDLLRRSGAGEKTRGGRREPGIFGKVIDRVAPVPERIRSVEVARVEGKPFEEGGVMWSAVRVPAGEAQNALKALKRAGIPDAAVRVDPNAADVVLVAHGYASRAVQVLKAAFKKRVPYWTDGNYFVVLQDGIPVHVPAPPENGVNMGRWRQ